VKRNNETTWVVNPFPSLYLLTPGEVPIPIEWVGPSAGLDDLENRNLLILPRVEFQVVQHCHYSDHIIPTLSIDDTRKLSIFDAKS